MRSSTKRQVNTYSTSLHTRMVYRWLSDPPQPRGKGASPPRHLCVTLTSKSSLWFTGLLAHSSGLCHLFGDPLGVFSLLCPHTCSSEDDISFWFSMFADSVACVSQPHAKPRVCPSAPVILLGLDMTGFVLGAPWWLPWRGLLLLGMF